RYGLKQTGYVEHLLQPDGRHLSRLVCVGGLERLNIANFPQAYAQYAVSTAVQPKDAATEVGPF
ncbi:MAG TPA: hypothetical protein VHI72_16110, partial [Hyphomicrobiaceae bacterium]|nr:hypothetical protein [Hyphomicrobiaceae bacterium]